MPKVSVIIPTFNRAELVKKAIQSVLNQTCQDYEVIVVDDGSSDDTKKIVEAYCSQKIKYIYQKNSGVSSARNRGLEIARGEYIAFLDSDDIFLPDKLELQTIELDNNPHAGMVFSEALNIDEKGCLLNWRWKGNLSGWIYPDLLYIKYNIIATPTVMVRANAIKNIGNFNETMDMCEDLDLWCRIARKYQVRYIAKPLSKVRIRTNERFEIQTYLSARLTFYQNIFKSDPEIELKLGNILYSEAYWAYSLKAFSQRNIRFCMYLSYQSFRSHPILYLRTICSLIIRCSIKQYSKLYSIYYKILQKVKARLQRVT